MTNDQELRYKSLEITINMMGGNPTLNMQMSQFFPLAQRVYEYLEHGTIPASPAATAPGVVGFQKP